jgi:hypothetical protein
MEGTKKRERSCKRWRDEVENNLKIMRIKNRRAVARDHQEWSKTVSEAKVHNGP